MELIAAVFLAVFVALIVLGMGYELTRARRARRAGRDWPRHRRRLRRRLLGLLFLGFAVAVLVFAPQFDALVPNPFLQIGWIGMAFVFVWLAVWQALRDLGETGRSAQDEAQRVLLDSLASLQEEVERAKHEKSVNETDPPQKRPRPDHDRSRSNSRRARPSG